MLVYAVRGSPMLEIPSVRLAGVVIVVTGVLCPERPPVLVAACPAPTGSPGATSAWPRVARGRIGLERFRRQSPPGRYGVPAVIG
ncbi:hypothetical protein [Dactylosporangium sp. NPDC006015]|uniref:hypothetical protein n=1 Tax=Dactylosporangium sp. NPDC006015 TaxID=3154576 RepID=UPI0033A1DA6C